MFDAVFRTMDCPHGRKAVRRTVLCGVAALVFAAAIGPVRGAAEPERRDRLFASGNRAYEAGNYAKAIEAYRQILDAGTTSVALYHNLGNAYVRRGEMGPAIRAYAKGLHLQPESRTLAHNLQQARQRAGLSGSAPVLQSGTQRLVHGWPSGLFAVVGWLLLGAGLALAVYRTAPDRRDAWRRPRILALVGTGLLVWSVGLGVSSLQTPDRSAVVLSAEVPVHAAPADTAATVTTVREGMLLDVERTHDGWTRLRLPTGMEGWVRSASVGEV